MTNWNSEPYNDDFSQDKKFLKVLFRPGKAVQTRELNQIQSILQDQIAQHGDHVFKQGAMVIPGQVSIDKDVYFVRLRDLNDKGKSVNSIVDKIIGMTIVGEDSGVEAQVKFATKKTTNEPATIFIQYVSSGTSGTQKKFNPSEVLTPKDLLINTTVDLSVQCAAGPETINNVDIDVFGKASLASIEKGVYYINGYFVHVDPQVIVLEKYNNQPNYRVGLVINESIVKPEEDESLLDNSQGTQNYAAPGAHRYRIELILEKRAINSQQDKNFIELFRIENGVSNKEVRSSEYSILEQTLARRTYDESGDYVVRDFRLDIREDRNNDRGSWTASTPYIFGDVVSSVVNGKILTYVCFSSSGVSGSTRPVHTSGNQSDGTLTWTYTPNPFYNRGINLNGSVDKLSVGIEPGKAYVQGYEIEKAATERLLLNKARDSASVANVKNAIIPVVFGSYVLVSVETGFPSISTLDRANLWKNTTQVGTCRIRGIELHNIENNIAVYKLFIFDVIASGSIEDVTHVAQQLPNNPLFLSNAYGKFRVYEPQDTSLVYSLPYYAIKNIDDSGDGLVYTVVEKVDNVSVTNRVASISVAGSNKSLSSADDNRNYVIIQNYVNAEGVLEPRILKPSQYTLTTLSSGESNRRGEPYVTSLLISDIEQKDAKDFPLTVFMTVKKIGGGRKTKTLQTLVTQIIQPADVQRRTILLGKADGFKLLSVKMNPAGFDSGAYSVDITDRYIFDDGQRDTHYDIARITLKAAYAVPVGRIQVEFQYFEHGAGDFFNLHSYQGQVSYENIPFYGDTPLRDALDFRPRIDENGETFSSIAMLPRRATDVLIDFDYYLGRKCKVGIDYTGKFFIVEGEPALIPGEPEQPKRSMILYDLEIEPYTFSTDEYSVKRNKIDNRRFTMRDIGRIEKRVDNLEYYTSLTLLEQETSSFSVVDDNGLDRFKNGFIVDNFKGHGIGDTVNSDYLCSIDMTNGQLRPFFAMNNMNMIEDASTAAQRRAAKYQIHQSGTISLPIIDDVPLVDQPYASRIENVNPFAIFTFIGSLSINPSSDDWFEVDRLPDIVRDIDGNFNAIKTLAEGQGALGVVWNSWQTTWTGTSSTVGNRIQEDRSSQGARRVRALDIIATERSEARTGLVTDVVAKIDKEIVEDKIVSASVIPFMRSRFILVQAKGLKPNTVFYPFFDDVSVLDYCYAPVVIEYTLLGSSVDFDCSTPAGRGSKEDARLSSRGDAISSLNFGDVITQGNSTAIVVGKHESEGRRFLRLFNVKGSFATNQEITGSISKAVGRLVEFHSPPLPLPSGTLGYRYTQTLLSLQKSFSNGELDVIFDIPNTDSLRFRTGTREFRLIDSATNGSDFTSRGIGLYRASGVIESRQNTINSVRNAELVQTQISETRTVTDTIERVVADSGWHDPLAQTFLVESKGGAYLTKVDIFFSAKDSNIPVTLEIREVVNGYPGKRVLPFSRVTLNPTQVNISTSSVNYNGVITPSYDTPTTFNFSSPVYVGDGQEYCVVLLSDSNKYKVWISQLGETIPGSDRTISQQPYAGVLFKSQNASTWTADQYQDLKFKIYKAKFDISGNSNVTFINDLIPKQKLEFDPIEFKAGTRIIRVYQKDHGYKPGDSVTLSGVIPSSGSVIAGVDVSQINKTHVIAQGASVQLDSYIIVLSEGNVATSSGYFGGVDVYATRRYTYNVVNPIVTTQSLPETSILYRLNTSRFSDGVAFSGGEIAIMANENNTLYDNTKVVLDGINPSCRLICSMYSSNENVSPIIDSDRTSLILISNKIDSPTEENYSFPKFDPVQWKPNKSFFVDELVHYNNNVYKVKNPISNTSTLNPSVDTTNYTFVSENLPFYLPDTSAIGTSTYSNYITRKIKLLNTSSLIKVMFSANCPGQSNIELYYRTTPPGSVIDISTVSWTLLQPESSIRKVENGNETFFEVSYMKDEGSFVFDSLQLKIAMKSTTQAAVPVIKDLRVIACSPL